MATAGAGGAGGPAAAATHWRGVAAGHMTAALERGYGAALRLRADEPEALVRPLPSQATIYCSNVTFMLYLCDVPLHTSCQSGPVSSRPVYGSSTRHLLSRKSSSEALRLKPRCRAPVLRRAVPCRTQVGAGEVHLALARLAALELSAAAAAGGPDGAAAASAAAEAARRHVDAAVGALSTAVSRPERLGGWRQRCDVRYNLACALALAGRDQVGAGGRGSGAGSGDGLVAAVWMPKWDPPLPGPAPCFAAAVHDARPTSSESGTRVLLPIPMLAQEAAALFGALLRCGALRASELAADPDLEPLRAAGAGAGGQGQGAPWFAALLQEAAALEAASRAAGHV